MCRFDMIRQVFDFEEDGLRHDQYTLARVLKRDDRGSVMHVVEYEVRPRGKGYKQIWTKAKKYGPEIRLPKKFAEVLLAYAIMRGEV